jgi:hypothetical protein
MENYFIQNKILKMFKNLDIEVPEGFIWMLNHHLIGLEAFSQLEPWHLCDIPEIIPLSERWNDLKMNRTLIPFARRQDDDELACFEVKDDKVVKICTIHYQLYSPGTAPEIEILDEYPSVWGWLKSVVSDIEDWAQVE